MYPGGKSTTGRLYQDAGAAYVWAEDEHSGSIPLSFETVFDRGQDADFWLFKYNRQQDKTLDRIKVRLRFICRFPGLSNRAGVWM